TQPQRRTSVGLLGPDGDPVSGTSQDVPTESCAAVPASPSSLNHARVARRAVSSSNEPPLSASGGSKSLGGSSLGAAEATPRLPTSYLANGVALMPRTTTSAPTAGGGQVD